jgi:hypothetical protein
MAKKKTERQQLVLDLDEIVSKIIRLRDGGCVQCGFDCVSERNPTKRNSVLNNGHVFSRKSYSLRWDIRPDGNCHCQCWGDNYRHISDQYPYFKWYIGRFGQERFDKLREESKQTRKWKNYELKEELIKLTIIYDNMVSSKKRSIADRTDKMRLLDSKVKNSYSLS